MNRLKSICQIIINVFHFIFGANVAISPIVGLFIILLKFTNIYLITKLQLSIPFIIFGGSLILFTITSSIKERLDV